MGGAGHWGACPAGRQRDPVIKRNTRLLAVLVLVCAGACTPALLLTRGPTRWFIAGAAAVAAAWLIGRLLRSNRVPRRRGGADAERWTSRRLKGLGRYGWRCLDRIPFPKIDVDHVLFGRDGVFAIETKWTGAETTVERGSLRGTVGRAIGRALDGQKRIAGLLRAHGVDVPVIPTLVMWGSETDELETTFLNSGVLLLPGRHGEQWHRQLPTVDRPIGRNTLQMIERALRAQIASGADESGALAPLVPLAQRV